MVEVSAQSVNLILVFFTAVYTTDKWIQELVSRTSQLTTILNDIFESRPCILILAVLSSIKSFIETLFSNSILIRLYSAKSPYIADFEVQQSKLMIKKKIFVSTTEHLGCGAMVDMPWKRDIT